LYTSAIQQKARLLGSGEADKFRYDKSVYVGVVGNCAACYYCMYACPENAIKDTKLPTVIADRCTRCMRCVEACPRRVMQVIHY
jgi:Fe-S-cluster-containing hydrogenase component 2